MQAGKVWMFVMGSESAFTHFELASLLGEEGQSWGTRVGGRGQKMNPRGRKNILPELVSGNEVCRKL